MHAIFPAETLLRNISCSGFAFGEIKASLCGRQEQLICKIMNTMEYWPLAIWKRSQFGSVQFAIAIVVDNVPSERNEELCVLIYRYAP